MLEECEPGGHPQCPTEPGDPPPEPEPVVEVTGDPDIDTWIGGNNPAQMTGVSSANGAYGGFKVTIPGQPVTTPQGALSCGSGVPGEANCPNDTAYMPGPFQSNPSGWMGGMDAWGVALQWAGGPQLYFYCWTRRVSDSNGEGRWESGCDVVEANTPRVTYGASVTIIAWNKVTLTEGGQTFYRSVASYKQPNLSHCVFLPGNNSCIGSNSVYVPDAGYEDKMIIPNFSCTKGTRSDDASDRQAGCFVVDRVVSNLTPYYRDTTAFDSGDTFVASAGFTNPAGIVVTKKYTTEIRFSARGWESIAPGVAVKHRGAITTRLEANPACALHGFDPAWCYFNVDSRTLSQRGAVEYEE
jgi:hypothetical protein